jgi:hypothetical protein
MDRGAQETLRRYVEGGGSALVGPSMPGLDGMLGPYSAFPAYQVGRPVSLGKGRLLFLDEWNAVAALEFLEKAGVAPILPQIPTGILATRMTAPGREAFFLANPSDAERVLPPFGAKGEADWKPLYGAGKPWKAGREWTLEPWSVAAFEVMSIGEAGK